MQRSSPSSQTVVNARDSKCVQKYHDGYLVPVDRKEEDSEEGFQTLNQQVQSTTQERLQKKHNFAQMPALVGLRDASTLRAGAAGGR